MLRTLGNGKLWNSKMKKKKKKKKKKMNTRKEKEEGGEKSTRSLAGRIRFVNGLSADDKVIRAVHHARVHGPQKTDIVTVLLKHFVPKERFDVLKEICEFVHSSTCGFNAKTGSVFVKDKNCVAIYGERYWAEKIKAIAREARDVPDARRRRGIFGRFFNGTHLRRLLFNHHGCRKREPTSFYREHAE